MEYDPVPARKVARQLIEAARRAAVKTTKKQNPSEQEINVQLQLLFNGVKNEVRNSKYKLIG